MPLEYRAITPPTCWDDLERVSIIRTGSGPLVAAYQTVSTGAWFTLSAGDLPTGTAQIRLGVQVDTTAPTMDKQQSWDGAPAAAQIDAPPSAAEGLHSLLREDMANGTAGELSALTDDEECEVDANGEPVGDPGEDYTAGLMTQLGGLVVRFLDWSSRNHHLL